MPGVHRFLGGWAGRLYGVGRAPEPNGYAWWVLLYPTMTETAFINEWAATSEAKALMRRMSATGIPA
ncbi:hypothetical protein [Chelatococcus asaccharovorans]|uniref:Uncharacterized protein n=1 Tax=Chelatococcus asaccharovorans TaxID=28210 RepID=A0A2V3U5S2_9HYPH|nr:hypothetical protein [Chelatococcus asaccharovorans]MBS7703676.1 hypothetical protein [Chelatococcus asaccharovorans]PXW57834.1 hypothetical protein C7450_1066 [Chelatococcus asaccharovorans]